MEQHVLPGPQAGLARCCADHAPDRRGPRMGQRHGPADRHLDLAGLRPAPRRRGAVAGAEVAAPARELGRAAPREAADEAPPCPQRDVVLLVGHDDLAGECGRGRLAIVDVDHPEAVAAVLVDRRAHQGLEWRLGEPGFVHRFDHGMRPPRHEGDRGSDAAFRHRLDQGEPGDEVRGTRAGPVPFPVVDRPQMDDAGERLDGELL